MASMKTLSPMVTQRLDTAKIVIETTRSHASELAAALATTLDVPQDHLLTLIHAQAALLERASEEMERCERDYVAEQDDDVSLRGKIAEAGIELDHKLRLTREHIRSFESDDTLAVYGLDQPPPRARAALVGYAQNAILQLRAHPFRFSGELGQVIDTRKVAVLLDGLLEPFDHLVTEMSQEMSQLRASLDARNAAVDAWTDTYQGVSCSLEGLFHLAGLHHLAERIRPSYSRVHGAIATGSEEE
jgi:hypothetical protein